MQEVFESFEWSLFPPLSLLESLSSIHQNSCEFDEVGLGERQRLLRSLIVLQEVIGVLRGARQVLVKEWVEHLVPIRLVWQVHLVYCFEICKELI